MAETMPMLRRLPSGDCWTDSIARLAVEGKAENTNPSITKTRPSATMKSDMEITVALGALGYLAPCVCGGAAGVAGVAGAPLPEGSTKKRKNSESGFSTMRVSVCCNAFS
jgi:hypothetical protein